MKVEIIIDKSYKETTVKIFAPDDSEELTRIKTELLSQKTDKLTLFSEDGRIHLVDFKDIKRIYTEGGKMMCATIKDIFTSRLKLYELEQRLPQSRFIKISRFEIVNLDYVKGLDLSFTGTIALEMVDGHVSYVSRRHLKAFKEALGL